MTTPSPASVPPGFRRLAEAVWGQEHVGIVGGLLHRLYRYLGGDPSAAVNVTSTGTASVQGLPDNTPASSATLTVQGNGIAYTLDGTTPSAATSAQLAVGTVFELTGQPSIKGFQFVSLVAGNAQVVGHYFT